MKKFLLSLLALGGITLTSYADTMAFQAADATSANTSSASTICTISGDEIPGVAFTQPGICEFKLISGNTSTESVASGWVKWYKGSTISITPADGVTVTSLKIKCGDSKYGAIKIGTTSLTTSSNAPIATFNNLSATKTSPISMSNGAQIRFSYIEIEYTKVSDNGPKIPEASFPKDAYSANLGSDFVAPKLSTNSSGAITYTSSNPEFATVNNDGDVKLHAVGTTVISATVAAVPDEYIERTVSYTLTVNPALGDMPIVDVLTKDNICGTSYANGKTYTTSTSGVDYEGHAIVYSNAYVQMNAAASTGIFTTANDNSLVVSSIKIDWGSTTSGNGLRVHFSNTPFTKIGDAPSTYDTYTSSGTNSTSTIEPPKDGEYTHLLITGNGKVVYVKSIEITWRKAAAKVEAPEIVFDETTGTVTINSANDVYYTLDGTTPTNESLKYDGPFHVSQSCTIKAVAYDGTTHSEVAEKNVVITTKCSSIKDLYDIAAGETVTVTASMSVIAMNGTDVFVTDGTRNTYLNLAEANPSLANISSFTGVVTVTNGIYHIANATATAGGEGVTIDPINLTAEELEGVTLADNYDFMAMKDVAVSKTEVSHGESAFPWLNLLGIEIPEGPNYDVEGLACINQTDNDVICIIPVAFKSLEKLTLGAITINGTEVIEEETYTFELGKTITFAANNADKISICAFDDDTTVLNITDHEGASYEWTPTATGSFACEVDVEGCDDIDQASFYITITEPEKVFEGNVWADFIFNGENENATTFVKDFTLAASNSTSNNTSNDLTNVTFVHPAKISTTFAISGSENHPRFWENNGATDLRVYKGNTVTITSTEYPIKQIVFIKSPLKSSNLSIEEQDTQLGTIDTDARTWTAASNDVYSIKFNVTATNYLGTVRVVYYGPLPDAEVVGFTHNDAKLGDKNFTIDYTLHIKYHHDERDKYKVKLNLYKKGSTEEENEYYDSYYFESHTNVTAAAPMMRRAIEVNPKNPDATHQLSGTAFVDNLPDEYDYTATVEVSINGGEYSTPVALKSDVPLSIKEVGSEADAIDSVWYDMAGRRVANPTNGVYIKKHGSAVTKHVL